MINKLAHMLSLSSKIKREFNKLDPDATWSFKDIGRSETHRFTHNYHRYPAKFIPHIVEKLITDYTAENSRVCDPFGGCGTTLVEAMLLHRNSIGFDINPIAKLVTQTKVTAISPKMLEKVIADFHIRFNGMPDIKLEHCKRIKYWFDENALQDLSKIYFLIDTIGNYKIRRFFLCAFSHILKNCSRWLMKSIKPTIDQDKVIPEPKTVFLSHLNSMVKKNKEFYEIFKNNCCRKITAKMRLADSTKLLPLNDETIDLIVTSPPYVTSYEYADLHQLSLLWFRNGIHNFKTARNYTNFRKKFVGSKFKNELKGGYRSTIADEMLQALAIRNKRIARNVSNYFIDMKNSFTEMYRVLKKRGKACIIIGNTRLENIPITNAQVAAEQMQNIGFKKITYIKREVPNKMITPWRDSYNGRFTGLINPAKKRVYEFEYIIIMEK